MRTKTPARPFLRPLLTTALATTTAAVLLLTGCGTQRAASADAPAGGDAARAAAARAKGDTPADTPPDSPANTLSDSPDAEARFLALIGRAMTTRDPDAPTGADEPPRPEDLPGGGGGRHPALRPGQDAPAGPGPAGRQ